MFVLALLGSPRKGGNTESLLFAFLEGIKEMGGEIKVLNIAEKRIFPCIECGKCEKNGFCFIKDDMEEIYFLLRQADAVILATPVFFYNVPAQLKAFIDRCQVFWVRRYILNLIDPKATFRLGFLLTVGATKGKNLFFGIELTAKYFFKAIGAKYKKKLGFKRIEKKGDIIYHPTALKEAYLEGKKFIKSFKKRKKIIFISQKNACRSHMAEAFLQYYAGKYFDVKSAGIHPASNIDPLVIKVMAEKGIDLVYRRPKKIEVVQEDLYDLLIQMDEGYKAIISANKVENWNIKKKEKNIKNIRQLRDEIEKRIKNLIKNLI